MDHVIIMNQSEVEALRTAAHALKQRLQEGTVDKEQNVIFTCYTYNQIKNLMKRILEVVNE